jgi:MEDS: MEthanogen/methylotroph, DcmR Sensory domain
MESTSRHQCLIYEGAPSRHLPHLAAVMRQKLRENYRCLYLNSPPMVAGIKCYLAAAGIDVVDHIAKTSLVLSSDQTHLVEGRFEIARMMQTLEEAMNRATSDGYKGLWVTGDMGWEFGPLQDFSKLLEYEWRLEDFLRKHPLLGGICQYHTDTLPRASVREALITHQSIFVNETLSRINPHFVRTESFTQMAEAQRPELDEVFTHLCEPED